MIDTKRIHEIQDTIKETGEVGIKFFGSEFQKLLKSLDASLKEYNSELAKLSKEMATSISDLKLAQDEASAISQVIKANKGKLEELDKKDKELKEKEENLFQLHKVLSNREKMIGAKEKELQTTARRRV